MNANLFYSALFRFRNIGTLIFWCAFVFVLSGAAGGQNEVNALVQAANANVETTAVLAASYGTGAALYIALVIQSLFSSSFKDEVLRKEKKREINDLNRQCSKLFSQTKMYTTPIQRQKLKKIMQDKDDIYNSLKRGDAAHSYLKEKIVERSLNLVVSYVKLMTNYCIRSKELSEINISELMNKINVNRRKLNFMKDDRTYDDIKSIIEMDEQVIQRVKEEKNELERIHARLDYIESMLSMFKHQIVSSIESEEMVEKLETAVNEATALDNVLQERRRNQIRM